jgi:hypothetical protein
MAPAKKGEQKRDRGHEESCPGHEASCRYCGKKREARKAARSGAPPADVEKVAAAEAADALAAAGTGAASEAVDAKGAESMKVAASVVANAKAAELGNAAASEAAKAKAVEMSAATAARTNAATFPAASGGAEMPSVPAPPAVKALSSSSQPSHVRARPKELPTKPSDVGPMIRRAAAFRLKYRRPGGLVCLPLQQVGFHPQYREGQPPNGDRCASLCDDILALGFDAEEANAGGICVEQRPGCHTFEDFNKAACDGDDFHAPVAAGMIWFGTLSHSHMHQVLKNIRASMPGIANAILDSSGRYSLSKLRILDPAFAAAVDTCLYWDILAWEMEIEEPEACVVIQAAMHSRAALSLLTHEMQAFSHLCSLASSRHSGRISLSSDVEFIREQLARTLPQFAADGHFFDMYRFIFGLGSLDAPFVKDLMAFHQHFVDPKVRRLRLNVFATMSELGLNFPHLKIAGITHAYSCDAKRVQHGFCEAATVKMVKDAVLKDGKVCQQAEDILRWFHVDCHRQNEDSTRGHGVHMDFTKVLGVLDREIFGASAVHPRSWRRILPAAAPSRSLWHPKSFSTAAVWLSRPRMR